MVEPRGKVERLDGPLPDTLAITINKFRIGAWCPDLEAKTLPEEVHLTFEIDGLEDLPMAIRFSSPDTLGFLIEELSRYRREVWPDCIDLEVV